MDNKQSTPIEYIKENAIDWDLEKWTSECALLSQNQLSRLVPLASPTSDKLHWKEKLYQLFTHLVAKTPPDILISKEFGKALSTVQILEIMNYIKHSQDNIVDRQKLSSLLAGISPLVFKDIIVQASQDELNVLKEEALTEAVQHNLSLVINEVNTRFNSFCNKLSAKENEIGKIDLRAMSKEEIFNLYQSVETFHAEGKTILNLASRALIIAWNANRIDFIQELGRIRELCQKCLLDNVGKAADAQTLCSGLLQSIERKVESLFSDEDTNGNVTIMKDSTPALEALVKFSVWYIQDYYEVGLLPQIKSLNTLDLSAEKDSLKKREQLFIAVEKNLNKIGLKTLLDLKTARIYSKKALMEYISAFQTQLTPKRLLNHNLHDEASPEPHG